MKKMLQIPLSWKQYDPYSRPPRPLGLGPRLVRRDSDLELKKAERRGGSSWVTAGIPRSLPAAGEGGKGRAEVGDGVGGGWLRYVGGCLSSWQIHIPAGDNKDSGPDPSHTSFLDLNSRASSPNSRADGGSETQVLKWTAAERCTLQDRQKLREAG